MATVTGFGSPASSGSQGARPDKAAAKKALEEKAKALAEAVTLLPVLEAETKNLPRQKSIEITIQNPGQQPQTIYYSRADYRAFQAMVVSRIKLLPREAFAASKTVRHVASGSGFDSPQRFRQEIVNFFAQVALGPQVAAQPMVDEETQKVVPNMATAQVQQGSRLNDALYFVRPNINQAANPLYRIISHGILTPLFALHIYYTGGQNPDEGRYLTATPQMRQILRPILEDTIRKDVTKYSLKYSGSAQQIEALGAQLIAAIDNPSAQINSEVGEDHMFNPNAFPFAHFSKIISAGKDPNQVTKQQLIDGAAQIIQVYQQLPEFNTIAQSGQGAADRVMQAQKFSISAARGIKNAEKNQQTKVRRQELARQKRVQTQQAALLQAQQAAAQQQQFMMGPSIGMLPGMATGLPGMTSGLTGLPGLPTVGGL